MNIIGKHIDIFEKSFDTTLEWQNVLNRHIDFFLKSKDIKDYDETHINLSFFTFIQRGEFGNTQIKTPDHRSFSSVPLPNKILLDSDFNNLVDKHVEWHNKKYGPGTIFKMGLYDFGSGGSVPYHIDGPVVTSESPLDLENPVHRKQIEEMHATHRTLLVLSCNATDILYVVDKEYKIEEGMFFELNNVIPHAFRNNGLKNSIFLITTFQAESEMFK